MILQTFDCKRYGHESHLKEQLTIKCDFDTSPTRKLWVVYASIMTFLYPIGVPAVMLIILCCIRRHIKRVMTVAVQRGETVAALLAEDDDAPANAPLRGRALLLQADPNEEPDDVVGRRVEIVGLKNKEELNGLHGIVEKVLGEGLRHSSGQDVGGRLNVRIDHSSGQLPEGHERGGLLALKRGNLRFI